MFHDTVLFKGVAWQRSEKSSVNLRRVTFRGSEKTTEDFPVPISPKLRKIDNMDV